MGYTSCNNFYGICPGYDLTNLGLSSLETAAADSESIGGSADDGTYLDPANLPLPGNKVLSNTEGSGPLTTPPGGATMTVTLLSTAYTITAASYTGTSSTTTGASSSQGSGSQTSSSTSATKTNVAPKLGYTSTRFLISLGAMLMPQISL
ncbi:hypothetical protein P175DRAFT_0530728 [Aspergillus ochraceoroseus IBT 24754]|uniref:Uncharacterized protein n=1 Tax=Aspergillus ochraceoroseus IBT 24754 TaxID=1392256 RepID=A0A2T5M4Y2_9EURO|nr:uncharacterized protein P175DRAFT_0530728 [Aspergillus ochraceoroseus IBT 24754]PTU23597.1 hypothetical protein P175DRAFT_0530728 [Aspergillus ochraceoroseus IBT 24754]